MIILLTMLLMGLLLGFIGAGGSGFVIAILTVVFHVPIHIALATSVTAMIFTMISGAYSHLREGNTLFKLGAAIGLFGGIGAYLGTLVNRMIPAHSLTWMTGSLLILSGMVILIRLRLEKNTESSDAFERLFTSKINIWLWIPMTGLLAGILSGIFGIGSTPFIQIALLVFFHLPIRKVVGTTMVIILPVALFGSLGYIQAGYFNGILLLKVVLGTIIGSYIGAKFTGKVTPLLLKGIIVAAPILGGSLLFIK